MKKSEILSLVISAVLCVSMAYGEGDELPSDPPASTTEAPAGFDGETNGFVSQEQHDLDTTEFSEVEELDDGLGPMYNAQSCRECHQNPTTGGISQISEVRAARFVSGVYSDNPSGSLIHSRATNPDLQARVAFSSNVIALRMSLGLFGDGFVESIADSTILAIRDHQPPAQRGLAVSVPILEAPGKFGVGRFGWKAQHRSLLSFSADAYVNEMGVTNELIEVENLSNGRFVGFGSGFDGKPEPDNLGNIFQFASFMRALKVPPRRADFLNLPQTAAGERIFDRLGCATCHVKSIQTAPPGTVVNGGAFTVPDSLGNKTIHPFSDFLLHDIGTGDGIIQNGGPESRLKMRTPPLWGLRAKDRLLHDGSAFSRNDAILRHAGQAEAAKQAYQGLTNDQKNLLLTFLNSL